MVDALSSPAHFSYDSRSMRYRHASSGRYIPAQTVRAAVDSIIDKEAQANRGIAQDLLDGRINLAEFQMRMSTNVKRLHVAMGIAGNGGVNATDASDYGYMGSLVKKQYQFLRNMADQIKSGQQELDGTLLSRVELYAQAARDTHEKMRERTAKANAKQESRSVLGIADHCSGENSCISEAKRGWVPIGENIPIGQRKCKSRCHCSLEFR